MRGAQNDKLLLTGRALEILSAVSGGQLASAQRRALMPTVTELLTDASLAAIGSGPQSQADVIGACLGLAMFAIKFAPAKWTFAHIPASPLRKSPDIYAIGDHGEVWFVELKAVAPSDSDFEIGGKLDTCRRISAQRNRAIVQLRNPQVHNRGGPAIRVAAGRSAALPTSGVAYVVTVLPRAGLVGRSDLQAAAKRGCPKDTSGQYLRCSEDCLDGSYLNPHLTTPVVLWGEQSLATRDKVPVITKFAGFIRNVNGGLWAGSCTLVDSALAGLALLVSSMTTELRENVLSSVHRILRASRLHSSQATRKQVVEALGGVPDDIGETFYREASRGLERISEPKILTPADLRQGSDLRPLQEIVCSVGDRKFWGTCGSLGARLAPDVREVTDAIASDEDAATLFASLIPRSRQRLKREFVTLVQRLVDKQHAVRHPQSERKEASVVVGYSVRSFATTHRLSAWISLQGPLELRFRGD